MHVLFFSFKKLLIINFRFFNSTDNFSVIKVLEPQFVLNVKCNDY